MEKGWYQFVTTMENITTLGDVGDFFALIGSTTPWRLLELRVWQRGSTTLTMETLRISRGTAVAGGTGLTEHEYTTAGPTPSVTGVSLPTTDATADFVYRIGWNILQEAVWLPPPRQIIPCKVGDDIAIGKDTITVHTGVGVTAVWEEYIGS